MKKIVTNYLYGFTFLILLSVVLVSCEKTQIQFGQAYVDNSFSNIVLVDTLSTQLSTVYYDSVTTSSSGVALVGNYADDAFGKVSAKSFFEITPPSPIEVANSATFDSLIVILRPNKSYYGDTTQPGSISVYQLQNELNFSKDKTQFYNTTDFATDPVALGTTTALIYPNSTDSVVIRLSDAKGKELFDLFKSHDYIMQSNASFLNYFKGLQLSSAGKMHAIYGFSDSVIVRLHYH